MLVLAVDSLLNNTEMAKARELSVKLATRRNANKSAGFPEIVLQEDDEFFNFSRVFSIDTETFLIKEHTAGVPQLVCVSIYDSKDPAKVKLYTAKEPEWLAQLIIALEDPSCMLVSHNMSFDLPVLIKATQSFVSELGLLPEEVSALVSMILAKYQAHKIVCTKVYGNILRIKDSRQKGFAPSLAMLVKELYGVEVLGKLSKKTNTKRTVEIERSAEQGTEDEQDTEDAQDTEDEQDAATTLAKKIEEESVEEDIWRKRYSELVDVPLQNWPKDAVEYACRDALYHRAVFDSFYLKQLTSGEVARTWSLNAMNDFALKLAGARGIKSDVKMAKGYKKELLEIKRSALRALHDQELIELKQKRDGTIKITKKRRLLQDKLEQLAAQQGIELPRTKTGKPATTESTILLVDKDRALAPWITYSGSEKLLSTYIPPLVRGTLYPNYNVLVETFRTSCKDPNVQNLPRKGQARECIIPRDGFIFIGADFDIAELCSLSEVMYRLFGFSIMGDLINKGVDIHLWMAAKLHGSSYEEVYRLYKADDPKVLLLRQLSKALDFGYPGGLGPLKFIAFARGYGVDVVLEESKEYKRLWLDTFSDMKEYFSYVNRVVGGFGTKGDVQHPITKAIRGGCTFTQAANFLFQHITAIIIKEAWNKATVEGFDKTSPLYGFRPLLLIHDEIIGELPREAGSAGAKRLVEVMREAAQKYSKHVIAKASPYMMERWIKGAKAVYDENGTLLAYSPKKKVEVEQEVQQKQENTDFSDTVITSSEELDR